MLKFKHLIAGEWVSDPKTDLICGARDMLLSDTLSFYQRAIDQGLDVTLEVLPDRGHGFAAAWFRDSETIRIIDRLFAPAQAQSGVQT